MEQQIDWFEDSLQKWVFKPAKLLLDTENEDNDYAILAILNAVPEMLAKCQGYEKTYNSETFCGNRPGLTEYLYRKGIEFIFPDRDHNVYEDDELIVKLIYGKLRCGLAHFAFADERILLSRDYKNLCSIVIDKVDISYEPEWVYMPPNPLLSVNVLEWYEQTKKRVNDYLNELRDDSNKDLRKNFQKQIILGSGGQQKNMNPECVCGPKGFCFRCAAVKRPILELGELGNS